MRLALLSVVVTLGVALAIFGPDNRRAPDIEAVTNWRLEHRLPGLHLTRSECARTERSDTYLCDIRGYISGIVGEKGGRYIVTAPSEHPNL